MRLPIRSAMTENGTSDYGSKGTVGNDGKCYGCGDTKSLYCGRPCLFLQPGTSHFSGKRVAAPPKIHQRRPLSQQNVSPPSLDVS